MTLQRFDTQVASGERGRVFIDLPFKPRDAWGKPVRYVQGTLNGIEFHASIGVRGGQYFMPLNKDLQKAAALKPGDRVSVTMEPDEAHVAVLPDDFVQALGGAPQAQQFFSGLTAFQQNTYLEWIAEAKKAETRAARIQESVQLLQTGNKQR